MLIRTFKEVFGYEPTIETIVKGFNEDTKTGSVKAFDGQLEIRPPYQREFVYEPDRQKAVIETILDGCPLSVIYWAVSPDGKSYEMLDGQQRTMSICKFVNDGFSIMADTSGKMNAHTFSSLPQNIRERVMNYKLLIYICEGDEDDKMTWFRKINTVGIPLTEQEMRNAIYASEWTTDAKKYFSHVKGFGFDSEGLSSNGHKYGEYVNVLGGSKSEKPTSVVRQRLLEIVLEWAVDAQNRVFRQDIDIDHYMAAHINDSDATELWRYYEDVMEWVKKTFKTYHPEMAGVEWGRLYNMYHTTADVNEADRRAEILWSHKDEITNVKGIYEAALTGDLKFIHARAFDAKDKRWAYNKQKGVCPYCHGTFAEDQMEGDHIVPWSKGGATDRTNLQMLCAECNGKKSAHDGKCSPFDTSDYEPFNLEEWDAVDTCDSNIPNITND